MRRIIVIITALCMLCGCAELLAEDTTSLAGAQPADSIRQASDASAAPSADMSAAPSAGTSEKYSGIVARGIDVSRWQENINWARVAADGIDFAIIRAGLSGETDTYFERNYEGATAAGVDVGVYFYCYATTTDEALADAEHLLQLLGGRALDYPVFYDVEDEADFIALTTEQRTAVVDAFCSRVEEAGYTAGIYTGRYWLYDYFDSDYLRGKYDIWLAATLPEPPTECSAELWQYSHSGRVAGINGEVDLNVAYKRY